MSDFRTKIKNMLVSMGIDMSKVPDDAIPEEGTVKTFTEAEVQAQTKAAAETAAKEAKETAQKEFAESQKTERAEARKTETKAFFDNLKKEGKLIPAWEKLGLAEFMQALDGEEIVEFAAETKVSRLDWFKAFLTELPKVIDFTEIATRDKDTGDADPGLKLAALAREKVKADPKLEYSKALSQVSDEHPELVNEWLPKATV